MTLLTDVYAGLWADIAGVFSLALLTVIGLVVVLWDAFRNNAPGIPWLTAAGFALALAWELMALNMDSGTAFYGMVRTGGFAAFVNIIILISGLCTVVLSVPYLERLRQVHGEVYALILFATVGMLMLGTANHLVSIFVGLETMSVVLYILTGLVRDDERATESALKYFLLGAFSTGFFLYGMALLYGATGTMYLPLMGQTLAAAGGGVMFWAGVSLLLIGFLFKVSAAPFHMWTPDVYQGAPTTLTGFMSTASKSAAFASLILVLYYALPPERWQLVLAVIALITMVLGNVIALAQDNVKRMLAYSSIAHAGYVLVGLAAGTQAGYAGALYYLLVYTLMNIGAFGVLAMLEWDERAGASQTLDSLAGIGQRRPLLGVTMGIFLFSLTGFPPLAGFFGKYAVFAPAVDAGLTWLVIVGVLASAASAYYYLRVLVVFFFRTSDDVPADSPVRDQVFRVPAGAATVLVACAALLIILSIPFGQLMELTESFFMPLALDPLATMP